MARAGNPGHHALLRLATTILFLKNAAKEYRCLITLNRKRCGCDAVLLMLQSARDMNSIEFGFRNPKFRIPKFW
jgi:hypothetical protein